MGNRRTPLTLAKLADLLSERDFDFEALRAKDLSRVKEAIKPLGIDPRFVNFAIDGLAKAIGEAKVEISFPTPTKEELDDYYSRIAKRARELVTLLSPMNHEWCQIDRYWPENPDDSGLNDAYTLPLWKQLIKLEQAAAQAATQSREIRDHAACARRNPHEILAVAVAQTHADYFPHLGFPPGSNNSPISELYCALCYIAGVEPPASPRHSLRSQGSCEKHPGYYRNPMEFPYHKTAPQELTDEELEFLDSFFPAEDE
jgi:hypothetical protein